MDISAYAVRKITATAHHSESSHWIEMEVHERPGRHKESSLVMFMHGPNAAALADSYAAAINGVNEPAVSMSEAT